MRIVLMSVITVLVFVVACGTPDARSDADLPPIITKAIEFHGGDSSRIFQLRQLYF